MFKFLQYVLVILTALVGLVCLIIVADESYRYLTYDNRSFDSTFLIPVSIFILGLSSIVFQLKAFKIRRTTDYLNSTDESEAILDDVFIKTESIKINKVLWIAHLVFGLGSAGLGAYLIYITYTNNPGDPVQHMMQYATSIGLTIFGLGLLFHTWKVYRS